jgi:hypothetical protein
LVNRARAGSAGSQGLPAQNRKLVYDGVESLGDEPVVGPVGVTAGFEEASLLHDLEVVGNQGLAHVEVLDEMTDAELLYGEATADLHPDGISERSKGLNRGWARGLDSHA